LSSKSIQEDQQPLLQMMVEGSDALNSTGDIRVKNGNSLRKRDRRCAHGLRAFQRIPRSGHAGAATGLLSRCSEILLQRSSRRAAHHRLHGQEPGQAQPSVPRPIPIVAVPPPIGAKAFQSKHDRPSSLLVTLLNSVATQFDPYQGKKEQ
jgi:hypothetical protein